MPSTLREQVMDSQFQLHQDMISQNNYVLRKTEIPTAASAVVGVNATQGPVEMVGITSSEDDSERVRRIRSERKRRSGEHSPMQLISSVLSAQNVGKTSLASEIGSLRGAGGQDSRRVPVAST